MTDPARYPARDLRRGQAGDPDASSTRPERRGTVPPPSVGRGRVRHGRAVGWRSRDIVRTGAVDLLQLPVDDKELTEAVDRAIELAAQPAALRARGRDRPSAVAQLAHRAHVARRHAVIPGAPQVVGRRLRVAELRHGAHVVGAHAVVDERAQPVGEDGARHVETRDEIAVAPDAEERVADDEERPPLAEHLERRGERTMLTVVVLAEHAHEPNGRRFGQ